MSLFKGREDVYARRWESREGKKGYTPVCANEWKQGVCNKKIVKRDKCKHRHLVPLDIKAVEKPPRGMDTMGRDVVGLYPLLEDDTCRLLAVDFDKKEWQKDVSAFRIACNERGLEVAIEKSRSGNGTHVWVFFDTNIPATTARKLGNYEDQWKYLSQIKKLSAQEVEEHIKRLEKLVETMAESEVSTEKEKDEWKTLKIIKLEANDFPQEVKVVKSHMLYIDKVGISARALNQFKRIASFNNPDFFKTQAMRMPTYDKPRVIWGFEETEDALVVPRGCEEKLMDLLTQQNIKVTVQEKRNSGHNIDITFKGQLRDEQISAAKAMLKYENGTPYSN